MPWPAALALSVLLAGAAAADDPPPASLEGPVWELTHLGGTPYEGLAHISFLRDEAGTAVLTGEGPCNFLRGAWRGGPTGGAFEAGPLMVTRRACAALAAEGRFLTALEAAREARLEGVALTLSGPQAPALRFEAVDAPPPRN